MDDRNCFICGYYDMGNGPVPIVSIINTGDLVVMDDICGPTYISEVTVEDAIDSAIQPEILEKLGVTGVVVSMSGLYKFDGNSYTFSPITDLNTVTLTHSYDTEQMYDGEDLYF